MRPGQVNYFLRFPIHSPLVRDSFGRYNLVPRLSFEVIGKKIRIPDRG